MERTKNNILYAIEQKRGPEIIYKVLTNSYSELLKLKYKNEETESKREENQRKIDKEAANAEAKLLRLREVEEKQIAAKKQFEYKKNCLTEYATGNPSEGESVTQLIKHGNEAEIDAKYKELFEGVASVVLITRDDKDIGTNAEEMLTYRDDDASAVAKYKDTTNTYIIGCSKYIYNGGPNGAALNAEDLQQYLEPTLESLPQALFFYGQSGSGKSTQCEHVIKFYLEKFIKQFGDTNVGISISQVYGVIGTINPSTKLYDIFKQNEMDFGEDAVYGKKYIIKKDRINVGYTVAPNPKLSIKTINSIEQFEDGFEQGWTAFLDFILKRKFLRETENNPESSRSVVFFRIYVNEVEQIVLVDLPGNENKIGTVSSIRNSESAFIAYLLPIMQAIFISKKGNKQFLPTTELGSTLNSGTEITFRSFLVPVKNTREYRKLLFTREWALDEIDRYQARLQNLKDDDAVTFIMKEERGDATTISFNKKESEALDTLLTAFKLIYSTNMELTGNDAKALLAKTLGGGLKSDLKAKISSVTQYFKPHDFLKITSAYINPILDNLHILENPNSKLHLILTGWRSYDKRLDDVYDDRFDALCQTLEFAQELHAKAPAICTVIKSGGTRSRRSNKLTRKRIFLKKV